LRVVLRVACRVSCSHLIDEKELRVGMKARGSVSEAMTSAKISETKMPAFFCSARALASCTLTPQKGSAFRTSRRARSAGRVPSFANSLPAQMRLPTSYEKKGW